MEALPKGITFIPRYVKQDSDMEYGSVVTHENYNEKLNLNTSQGDYNTSVLSLLLQEKDPAKTVHVPYLDEVIKTEVDRIDARYDNFQVQIDAHTDQLKIMDNKVSAARTDVINIIRGVTKVGYATYADHLSGANTCGPRKYYGTDYNRVPGYYDVPDSLFAKEFKDASEYVSDIVFTPAEDSVTETMLTETVRTKLNRTSITSYNELMDQPKVNGITLSGNKSSADLGLQPLGNYLTSVPDTYALKTYVDAAVSPKLDTSTANSTFATITALNNLKTTVENNNTAVINTYARVGVNKAVDNPREGDLYITV